MVQKDVSLLKYNTFNLDYQANLLISLSTEEGINKYLPFDGKVLVMGGGSNFLFTSNYKGTIIYPLIGGINIESKSQGCAIISAGAGVIWDSFVDWCVNNGFYGLENLSWIPGKVGASPVQNIGAYGSEAKDFITGVRTVSLENGEIREFTNEECRFGYRDSIFKKELKGKYMVTKVFFRLATDYTPNVSFGRISEEVAKYGEINPTNIRKAIIDIRRNKLPDPEILGNAGSFFKNPVINSLEADKLLGLYPQIPSYPDKIGKTKLSAAWLIDQCGWKGKRVGEVGVHDKQPLVIVNYGKATGLEILKLSEEIQMSVRSKFSVELEREVEVVVN